MSRLTNLLRRLVSVRPRRADVPRARLGVLALEGRDVPAAITVSSGHLDIYSPGPNPTTVRYLGGSSVELAVVVNGRLSQQQYTNVRQIYFYGGRSNDVFENNTPIPCMAWGGEGNDILIGGSGNDRLFGEGGADQVFAGDGDDFVSGGAGGDWIFGDSGNDRLVGDAGVDLIYGNAGNDFLSGGGELADTDGARDVLYGGAGADTFRVESQGWNSSTIQSPPADFNTWEGDRIGGF